ncbi:MAG: bifunctional diaminohydroxyphosphoribosylaminopyrimidine deaminase/5-amino-6-(5-phosphoribosylamino)uracil reductase RibD, partial [Acidobacteriota bacterium]
MAITERDRSFLGAALDLAAEGRFTTSPNPNVGAVLVRDGAVVGRGFHRRPGGPHAEIDAFRDAGEAARGATLFVTLEPCDHHGRTPPCSVATIEAGVERVVAIHRDPNPRVDGGGFARLRASGIPVDTLDRDDPLVDRAIRLNWRFLVARVRQRPAVTIKWAMSLDGKIATAAGDSQWISSPAGRDWALEQRELHDAIVVGSGTALADDPRLTRRLDLAVGAHTRVVIDRRLRLSAKARIFDETGPVIVYASPAIDAARRRALEDRGGEVVLLDPAEPASVVRDLFERGIESVLVEGGGTLAAAFVEAG